MDIYEIFYSIQGEGRETGYPTVFIRTSGCNLRCSYCDTPEAYERGSSMSIEDILREVKKFPCDRVCVTGGEPLLQKETMELLSALIDNGYSVSIETNGSLSIKPLLDFESLLISLDIKCPSSRMHDKMDMNNLRYLSEKDQLKFVISDRVDYEYAKNIIVENSVPCPVFFQPVWSSNPGRLADWILRDGLSIRLGLQIHKVIWGEEKGR